jgi:hypothetical protein
MKRRYSQKIFPEEEEPAKIAPAKPANEIRFKPSPRFTMLEGLKKISGFLISDNPTRSAKGNSKAIKEKGKGNVVGDNHKYVFS